MGKIHVIGAAALGFVGSLWLSTLTRSRDHFACDCVAEVVGAAVGEDDASVEEDNNSGGGVDNDANAEDDAEGVGVSWKICDMRQSCVRRVIE